MGRGGSTLGCLEPCRPGVKPGSFAKKLSDVSGETKVTLVSPQRHSPTLTFPEYLLGAPDISSTSHLPTTAVAAPSVPWPTISCGAHTRSSCQPEGSFHANAEDLGVRKLCSPYVPFPALGNALSPGRTLRGNLNSFWKD